VGINNKIGKENLNMGFEGIHVQRKEQKTIATIEAEVASKSF